MSLNKAGNNSDSAQGSFHSIVNFIEADFLTDYDLELSVVNLIVQVCPAKEYSSRFSIDNSPVDELILTTDASS